MVHTLALLGLLLGLSPAPQSLKVNAPLAREALDVTAGRFVADAGSGRVAFVQDFSRLFATSLGGTGVPLRLDRGGPVFEGIFELRLTPGGEQVLFLGATLPGHRQGLYRVPLDGSEPPTRLSHDLGPQGHVGRQVTSGRPTFELTPDGTRVVYLAYAYPGAPVELFSVPLDGSVPARRLHRVLAQDFTVTHFTVGSGARVAFHLQSLALGFDGLLSAPVEASVDAVRLDGEVVGARNADFVWNADGSRVVYRRSETGTGWRLYSAPSDGSAAPLRLDDLPAAHGSVQSFEAAALGRVVYSADRDVEGELQLFLVDDRSGAAPVLQAPLGPRDNAGHFRLVAAGTQVLCNRHANRAWTGPRPLRRSWGWTGEQRFSGGWSGVIGKG